MTCLTKSRFWAWIVTNPSLHNVRRHPSRSRYHARCGQQPASQVAYLDQGRYQELGRRELGHMHTSSRNSVFAPDIRSVCSAQMLFYLLSDFSACSKPYPSIWFHGGHKLFQHLEPGRATNNLGVHGKDKWATELIDTLELRTPYFTHLRDRGYFLVPGVLSKPKMGGVIQDPVDG